MRRKSVIALALMGSLMLATTPALAKPKPTLAEIEAAKAAEAAKKKAADAAAKKLAAANLTLRQLTAKAAAARSLYLKAQSELNVATAAANAAAKHAAETAAEVAEAHRSIYPQYFRSEKLNGTCAFQSSRDCGKSCQEES